MVTEKADSPFILFYCTKRFDSTFVDASTAMPRREKLGICQPFPERYTPFPVSPKGEKPGIM